MRETITTRKTRSASLTCTRTGARATRWHPVTKTKGVSPFPQDAARTALGRKGARQEGGRCLLRDGMAGGRPPALEAAQCPPWGARSGPLALPPPVCARLQALPARRGAAVGWYRGRGVPPRVAAPGASRQSGPARPRRSKTAPVASAYSRRRPPTVRPVNRPVPRGGGGNVGGLPVASVFFYPDRLPPPTATLVLSPAARQGHYFAVYQEVIARHSLKAPAGSAVARWRR